MSLSIWHKVEIQVNSDPTVVYSSMGIIEIVSMDIQEDQIIAEGAVKVVTTNQRVKYVVSMVILLSYVIIDLTKIFLVPYLKIKEDKTLACQEIQTQLLLLLKIRIGTLTTKQRIAEYSNLTNPTKYSSIEKVTIENGSPLCW